MIYTQLEIFWFSHSYEFFADKSIKTIDKQTWNTADEFPEAQRTHFSELVSN